MATARDRTKSHLESPKETLRKKQPVPKKSAKTKAAGASPPRDAETSTASKMLGGKVQGKKPGRKKPGRPSVRPLEAAQTEGIAGIPEDAQIAQSLASLSKEDQAVARKVRELLAKHLGSRAAARLWLASRVPGFESTPLDAIRQGQAKMVLATLESQWGRSPTYA